MFLAAITLRVRVLRPLYTLPEKIANAISRDPWDFIYFVADDQSPSLLLINTGADVSYEILISENLAVA